MKTLTIVCSAIAFIALAGCGKQQPKCDEIVEHTMSLVPAEIKAKMESKKDEAIAKCEKMEPEARQCAADAKTMEDLMKCPKH